MWLNSMRILVAIMATLVAAGSAQAQSTGLGAGGELVDPDYFRVCADPNSLPFSNEKGEGFENKLAQLISAKLERKAVQYTWFPMATGFVRKTLGEHRCDVIMGYPQGDELVQNTNAYYRTAYALIYKKGSGLDGVESLDDPRLRDKAVGVIAGTPPATNLAMNGLLAKARPYQLMVDTRLENPSAQMVKDVLDGVIDAGLLWGPIAGYHAKKLHDSLVVVPLIHEKKGSRMVYRITMGVRATDQQWKRELNRVLRDSQKEINSVLLEYGVPLLDENNRAIEQ
jgi:quinoprotein dehydrogenase-associated probable ABC transporter substrate-binding protein